MLDAFYALPLLPMLVVVTALTGMAACLFHLFMQLPPGRWVARASEGMAPLMQNVVAAFAALSVAFLANAVWNIEAESREAVESEARSLRVALIYARQLAGSERDGLVTAAKSYGGAVKNAEWSTMETSGAAREAEAAMAELYRAGLAVNPANPLRQSVLAALDRLSMARETRLALAQHSVSATQWIVVLMLMLVLFAAIALGHSDNRRARAAALTLASLAVAVSLFGVLVHDRPFAGYLGVTPDAISRAAGNS